LMPLLLPFPMLIVSQRAPYCWRGGGAPTTAAQRLLQVRGRPQQAPQPCSGWGMNREKRRRRDRPVLPLSCAAGTRLSDCDTRLALRDSRLRRACCQAQQQAT
jgi:hypothetical protein